MDLVTITPETSSTYYLWQDVRLYLSLYNSETRRDPPMTEAESLTCKRRFNLLSICPTATLKIFCVDQHEEAILTAQ